MGKINDYLEKKIKQTWDRLTPDQQEAHSTKLDTRYLAGPDTHRQGPRAISRGMQHELRTKPGQFVYQSDIIRKKAYFYQKPDHREIVHQTNAILSAAIKKITNAVCAVEPQFIYPDQDDEEDPKIHKRSTKIWKERHGQAALRKALEKSIKHGIVLYEPLDVVEDWYTNSPFFIRSWDEITNVEEYELGFPVKFNIKPSNRNLADYSIDIRSQTMAQIPVNADEDTGDRVSKGFFFDPDNTDDHDGTPWFLGAWNNIIDYELTKEARNAYNQRVGNGFMVVGIPAPQYAKVKDEVKAKIKNIRNEEGLVIPVDKEYPIEITWAGSDVQVDFNTDLNDIRRDIIANIGFPERWLFGDPEGAMESSGKDRLQVHDEIKNIFMKWKRFMLLFLKYHEAITDLDDIEIRAPFELQLTEQEKVEVEQNKVTTAMMQMGVLTVDEIREKLGYEPMTDEQKTEMQPDQNIDTDDSYDNAKTGPTEPETTTKTDTEPEPEIPYSQLHGLVDSCTYAELERWWDVSRDTIGKIKRNMRDNQAIRVKTDAIMLDSVELSPDIYMSTGLIVPVQKKYYPEYKKTFIRSYHELAKAYDRYKTDTFPIGVYPSDSHEEGDVVSDLAQFGEVKFDSVDEKGIHGTTIYDLTKVDEILGPNNWIRKRIKQNRKINTSVGLKSTDIPLEENVEYEMNHNIKSFIATRQPRNMKAGVE